MMLLQQKHMHCHWFIYSTRGGSHIQVQRSTLGWGECCVLVKPLCCSLGIRYSSGYCAHGKLQDGRGLWMHQEVFFVYFSFLPHKMSLSFQSCLLPYLNVLFPGVKHKQLWIQPRPWESSNDGIMVYKDLAFRSLLRYNFTINTTGTEYFQAIHICTNYAEILQIK